MLRKFFNEAGGYEENQMPAQTFKAVHTFRKTLIDIQQNVDDQNIYKLDLMAEGLAVALYELEQSLYAANVLMDDVDEKIADQMDKEERKDYRLHVYFYKNALIRIFSTLDKLGYFMDLMYDLNTKKVKPHFSYFTVLRHMYHLKTYPKSQEKLYVIKREFSEPMQSLRHHRNLEIHVLNIDLADEMKFLEQSLPTRIRIEDIEKNMSLLQQGFEMVCRTMEVLFKEANKTIVETGRLP